MDMELPSGPFDESFANKNEEVDEYGIETSGEGIILSIFQLQNQFAAAYYEEETSQIFVLQDVGESFGDFALLRQLFHQVSPSVVVMSQSTPKFYLDLIKTWCQEGENVESSGSAPVLHLMQPSDFVYGLCKKRIKTFIPEILGEEERERRVKANFNVDFSYAWMIRALGGLLKFLLSQQKRKDQENEATLSVIAIRTFTVSTGMIVDANTLISMQVFRKDLHSTSKPDQLHKDEKSVFGLLNKCKSMMGPAELRRWLLRPLSDRNLLQDRLDAVEFLSRDVNEDVVVPLIKQLKKIKKISGILCRMKKALLPRVDWRILHETIAAAIGIQNLLRTNGRHVQLLNEMASTNSVPLQELLVLISRVICLEEEETDNEEENNFILKPGIDEELDKKKRLYFNLTSVLARFGQLQLVFLPDKIECLSMAYEALVGYMVCIPKMPSWWNSEEDSEQLEELEYVFSSDTSVYYRNWMTRLMDEHFGDVQSDVTDMENWARMQIQNVVASYSVQLLDAVKIAAQLDCLICLAQAAREMGLTKPTLTEDMIIDVEDGRHILYETMDGHPVIPNSILSGGKYPKTHVLTGPNSSGKTVYLKEVGILVYLTHIGCFLPVKRANLGVFDHIYTRLYTMDSLTDGISSFAVDVGQVSNAVSESGSRSLVILDEFGKGSLPEVGMSLLASTLEYWCEQGQDGPHVFASTHFHDIPRMFQGATEISFEALECVRENEDLIYLYRLVEGVIDSSFGIYAATKAGLKSSIVARSNEIFDWCKTGRIVKRHGVSDDSFEAEDEWCMYSTFVIDDKWDVDTDDPDEIIEDLLSTPGFDEFDAHCEKGGNIFTPQTG